MRITNLLYIVIALSLGACITKQNINENVKLPYDGSWEALQKMPIPDWFNNGKVGIFIHWGPYSVIGHKKGGRGYAEHVPKLIYKDTTYYYPYLRERWGAAPPEFGYKDIVPEFKAENWNPDKWAKLFAEVGAKYVVLTAEHHDGWANWDSELTPWNAKNMGPKRDLVGDLGIAVKKQGLKYAPSYHRERHSSFFTSKQYVVNAKPHADILEEIKRNPEAASLYGPFGFDKTAVDEYVARWKEIQNKYEPDFLWIDDIPIFTRDGNNTQVEPKVFKPEIQYFYDQCKFMITDFMNSGSQKNQEVYLNNKGKNRNWPDGIGCLEKDNLKLKVIGPKWQSCTTFGTSFGYLENDTYKTAKEIISEMVEVVSRNGNFLVNIGPKADGTIPELQVDLLHSMGDWLNINGKAIYATRYWKINHQEKGNLAFTTKGTKLYVIALDKPIESLVIEGTKGWAKNEVKSVNLLGSETVIEWEMTIDGLEIIPPTDLGKSNYAWSFEIETNKEQHKPNVIQTDASKALEGTKKVDLDGND
ncbi:alpha-L-fucosidase [Polaribacter sp.]|uniref:alpha-L-fucosidase n=1 Tax=Polaribacter sp. TaxID=1920175 RepID=UPI003EFA7D75